LPHRPMGFFTRKDRHGRMVTHPITQSSTFREPTTRVFRASDSEKMTLTFPDGTTIQAKNSPGIRTALRRIVAGLGSAAALPARTRAAFEEGEIAKLIERSQDRNLVVRLAAQRAFRRRFPEVYREFREQTHVPTVRTNPIWFDRDNTLSIGNGPIPLSFLRRLKAEGKDVGVASKNLSDRDIRMLREGGIKATRNKGRALHFAHVFVDDTALWRRRAEAKGVKALSPREALREL